jgi:hypothetical protein
VSSNPVLVSEMVPVGLDGFASFTENLLHQFKIKNPTFMNRNQPLAGMFAQLAVVKSTIFYSKFKF